MSTQHDLPILENPRTQAFSERWYSDAVLLTAEQKDRLASTYRNHMGVGIESNPNDVESFWNEVGNILPGSYSPEELEWLIQDCGPNGPLYMLLQIAPIANPRGQWSRDLSHLFAEMHGNK
tara:strand:- start:671 stop:1033 length:363 start_codon:yes stop_codon:yes gene_type:complete